MSVRHGELSLSEHEIEFLARAVADAPLVDRTDAPVRSTIARKLLLLKTRMGMTARTRWKAAVPDELRGIREFVGRGERQPELL
jgi:hypothetical protein